MSDYRVTLKNKVTGEIKKVHWLSYGEEDAKREVEIAHPGYEAIDVELK